MIEKIYCKDGNEIIRFSTDDKISAIRFIRKSDTFTTPNGTFYRISLKEALDIVEKANIIEDCPVFGKAIQLPCKWKWIE